MAWSKVRHGRITSHSRLVSYGALQIDLHCWIDVNCSCGCGRLDVIQEVIVQNQCPSLSLLSTIVLSEPFKERKVGASDDVNADGKAIPN